MPAWSGEREGQVGVEWWTTPSILMRALSYLPKELDIYCNQVNNLSFYEPGLGGRMLAYLDFPSDELILIGPRGGHKRIRLA